MKPTDLQQMMHQYQLIAENNEMHKYDDLIEKYRALKYKLDKMVYQLSNAAFEMRQLMTSDEFAFAANTDWVGSKAAEDHAAGGPPPPPTYQEWANRMVDMLSQELTMNPEDAE